MGGAIARSLVKKYCVFVYDRNPHKKKIPGAVFDFHWRRLTPADVVIIAVKPQDVPGLAAQVGDRINGASVIVSLAAGLSIARIQKLFRHRKVVRLMPNLGLKVGQGIAGWKSGGLSGKEKARVKFLLNQICENFEVRHETDIDKITALSGSGPAYFFYLAKSLQAATRALSFSNVVARKLVEKTFSAAAGLQRRENYDKLIAQVASRKGTTEAALRVLEKHRFGEILIQAVSAAFKRARELSEGNNK